MREPRTRKPSGNEHDAPIVRYHFAGSPLRAIHVDVSIVALWGVSAAALQQDLELWLGGVHEEDRPRLLAAWRLPSGERWDLVYRVVRPDGSSIRVRDQGVTLTSKAPRVRGRLVDVTAQHELEERLRFHSQIVDAIGQAVISTDVEGKITSWNRAAERLYGWTADEAIGQPVAELLAPPRTRRQAEETLRTNLRRQVSSTGEFVARTRDGREVVVETRATSLFDPHGRPLGRVAVSSDIGERKEAEQRLRETEARFRAIFQEAGIAIAIVDLQRRVALANQALGRLLGHDAQELVGRDVRSMSHPADWEAEAPQLDRLLAGDIDRYELNKRYRRRDGEYVWGRLMATVVRDEHGEPRYTIAMVEDVDDRRRAEADLRASREELRRLYAHLQVVREMEQTRIARDLHDELGQMLTALKLDVAWLRRRAGSAHGLSREEAGQRLQQASVLVDQTLEATRRLAMHLRPVVLDDLGLDAAIEWLVEEMARRAGFEWRLHAAIEDLRPERSRDTAAYRILQEALTNVARHARARRVEVRAVHKNGQLALSVRDDGRGIPRGAGQAPASMGIAGMRERARAFGGELTVRRVPGGGTRVSARLPDPPAEPRHGGEGAR